jgi:hypothetical protein
MSIDLNLIEIAEPELLFGHGQSMEHPKDGLLLYGPKESPQAGSPSCASASSPRPKGCAGIRSASRA